MDSKRTLAALAVAALVAFPAGATAKNSNSGGKDGRGPERVQDDGGGKKGKKPKKPKVKTYEFKGLVAAVNDGTVEVTITGGNKRGRELERQVVTFDVTNAKVKVADVNGDGKRDLADVVVGDRVMVQAKVAGPVSSSKVVPARHFLDKGPVKPPTDDDDDAPKAPETPEVPEAPAA